MDIDKDPPDGYVIRWSRAFGSTLTFGPFGTVEDAEAWAEANLAGHNYGLTPCYLTVDWRR
jgi:hypothetical protein